MRKFSVGLESKDIDGKGSVEACREGQVQIVQDQREQEGGLLTVVALLALGAVAGHVAEATAGVASLRTARALTVGGVATATVVTTTLTTTLGAVTGNVADLAALVALLAAAAAATTSGAAAIAGTAALGALARQVAGLAAAVAGTLLGRLGALAVWRGEGG